MVITLDERGQHFIPWEEVSLSSYGRGSASLWLQSVGTCQQCEGNIVCLMSLTYTLSVSLKCYLYKLSLRSQRGNFCWGAWTTRDWDWEADRSLIGQQFDWTQNSAMLVVFWIIMCSNWEEQDRFVGRLAQYTRIFKWQMVLVGKWHLTALEADSYCWNVEGWWGRKEQVVAISFGRCILNCHQLCKNFPFQDRELCGIAFRY